MKKVKLIFGLLMLAVFSLSFVMENNTSSDNDTEQAVDKRRVKPPSNG